MGFGGAKGSPDSGRGHTIPRGAVAKAFCSAIRYPPRALRKGLRRRIMTGPRGARTMSRSLPPALQRWHDAALRRDAAALDDLLAEDVVFLSPVVHTPQKGRAITKFYLGAALAVLGNEHFRYVNEWIGDNSAVLEFTTRLGATEINGVDIIGWNADGRIVSFKVMVRPLQAIQAVHQAMAAMLAAKQQQQQ
jgi:hypothetical protein